MATVETSEYASRPTLNHSLISWRSVFAGLFVALLTYAILLSLGLGIGGLTLRNVVSEGGGQGLGIGSGIWLVLTNIIAVFVGGYFAARVSNYMTPRIGMAHGFVIAALFFTVMFFEMAMLSGMATRGIGSVIGGAGSVASDVAGNQNVQSIVENALGNQTFKSDVKTVAQGLLPSILRGDTEAAKNYLASQVDLPPEELESRIDEIQAQVTSQLKSAGDVAAQAIAGAGWVIFSILLLGTVSCSLGGGLGSRANHRRPMDHDEVVPFSSARSA